VNSSNDSTGRPVGLSRRQVLSMLAALPAAAALAKALPAGPRATRWVVPGDAAWPDAGAWNALARACGGRVAPVRFPAIPSDVAPARLSNPFFIGEQPALTQSSGWIDAWTSRPSAYALRARDARDVARAVDFARERRVRLVVRGGGHSYAGGSCAADSLLVWTRDMDGIELHDGFVPTGSNEAPVPAVSLGAGCLWGRVYDAVVTRAGRYVQGGGCTTVGVAGLVLGGGFGSFSKAYGLAAASLLEAELVTADGAVRTVNARRDADLFWALKGGGGGTFGIVTRLTLATHALPDTFGAVMLEVRARTDTAFRRLLERFLAHYRKFLFNPHWGEQVQASPDNRLAVRMVFQGLSEQEARAAWRAFLDAVAADAALDVVQPARFLSVPARHFWDADYLEKTAPNLVVRDDRPHAPPGNWWWHGDGEQAGATWHGFDSRWLPATLLEESGRPRLAAAWFDASRHWPVGLHFNKGLAGADPAVLRQSGDSSINPEVLGAFALAIIAGNGPSSYPGAGPGIDLARARADGRAIAAAAAALGACAPAAGSYLSESGYALADWRQAAWGRHWRRLAEIKRRVDPDGLFLVHHGIGDRAP
jgi:FAD/FMN-containing dehydrogenase